VLSLLVLLLVASTMPAKAQPAADADSAAIVAALETPDGDLSPEAAAALVARLSDREVRSLLLERLAATGAAGEAGAGSPAGMIGSLTDRSSLVRERLGELLGAVEDVPAAIATAWHRFHDGRSTGAMLALAAGVAISLVAAALAEALTRRRLARTRARLVGSEARTQDLLNRSLHLLGMLALDLLGLLVFAVVAMVVLLAVTESHGPTRSAVLGFLGALVAFRLVVTLSHFLLNPGNKRHRMNDLADADASFLHRWMKVIAAIGTFGFVGCALVALLGEPGAEHDLLLNATGALLVASVIYAVLKGRRALTNSILVFDVSSPMRRVLAEVTPTLTAITVFLIFVLYTVSSLLGVMLPPAAGLLTIAILVLVPYVDAVLERSAVYRRRYGGEAADAGGTVATVIIRGARLLLWIASFLVLAEVWSVDLRAAATAGVGDRISDALVDIGFAWFAAYLGWEFARIAIDRRIASEAAPTTPGEHGDEGGTGASRLATLLPLAKRAIQITIGVITVMITLSALGVDIGPLLAGAGVVGIAVGFGAQTLVRDVVSGAFFLLDDAFRVGEYVDVGSVKGTVEKISVRSFRLRHHRGALHTVPFGEIRQLTNYSRDWVIMKLEFRVPFDTDPDRVRKIFKQIGQDLLANPELGPDFIEPFKSQGVFTLDDSALVIRGKFMAKPGKQFVARREIYNAVQRAFAAAGIRFADRRVTVQVADSEGMTTEERQRVAQAAASALLPPAAAAASGS
jgi:small-conductance mechanosensitive channel